ncbi:MAG TPA: LysM peptidoglycan-binding domain-containing protein [Rhabdochlamydiaceae bacterium]|nr:LysM peptidoglycan-binding domain-containing protein [Rhabdochlamydiaceae bacterium]
MSRRDTIVIAVLINAGLLIVLFATALKSNHAEQNLAMEPSPAISTISELPMRQEIAKVSGDEVDQVLSQYSNTAPAAQSSIVAAPVQTNIPVAPAPSAPTAKDSFASQSFADDLQAISLPAPVSSFIADSSGASDFPEVTVKKGDVLEKIARVNATTVEEIMRINQLSSTKLKIGQVLRIPPKTGKKAQQQSINTAKTAPTSAKSSTPKFYVVKNGDNPWTIAVKNHMKVDELLKLNNLDEEKARRLKPGDQLRIK